MLSLHGVVGPEKSSRHVLPDKSGGTWSSTSSPSSQFAEIWYERHLLMLQNFKWPALRLVVSPTIYRGFSSSKKMMQEFFQRLADVTIFCHDASDPQRSSIPKIRFFGPFPTPLFFYNMGPSNSSCEYPSRLPKKKSSLELKSIGVPGSFYVTKIITSLQALTKCVYQQIALTPLKLNMEHKIMKVWKMIFLFNWVIFRFHVNLPKILRFRKSLASKPSL